MDLSRLCKSVRTPPRHFGAFAKNREITVCARSRGGGGSPYRTSLQPKFPANREISREFWRISPYPAIIARSHFAKSIACPQIPCTEEQGISSALQGNFLNEQRKSHALWLLCCPALLSALSAFLERRSMSAWRLRANASDQLGVQCDRGGEHAGIGGKRAASGTTGPAPNCFRLADHSSLHRESQAILF